jgi:hypothetical protein
MLNKYSDSPSTEVKSAPDNKTLQAILNYSKSLEVKEVKKERILIHLN